MTLTKEQLEAGAEVICDATGWPVVDCDYVMKLIVEAIQKAAVMDDLHHEVKP